MFDIIKLWFAQELSLPLIVTDLFLLWIGIYIAVKLENRKALRYIMLTTFVLYFAAVGVSKLNIPLVPPYAMYMAMIAFFVFIGEIIGLVYKKIKK